MHPAFQAGYAAGQKDGRQHRRRNRVLEDLSGLTAYAVDAALLNAPAPDRARSQKTRADATARYVDGYVRGYRLTTGQ